MCSVTNCAHVREDYARARIQSTMMQPALGVYADGLGIYAAGLGVYTAGLGVYAAGLGAYAAWIRSLCSLASA